LIEMLTVVAILAVLFALLFPVTSKMQDAALSTKCVARQKRVFQGILNYCQDNNGFFPSSEDPGSKRWMFAVQQALDLPALVDPKTGESPFLLEFKCPVEEEMVDTFVGVFCYNKNLGSAADHINPAVAVKMNTIARLSEFPVLGCHYPQDGGFVWDPGYLSPRAFKKYKYTGPRNVNGASPNHGRMCNVTFADGHCEAVDASRKGILTTPATFLP